VLISALTSSFLAGIQGNPAIPEQLSSQAQVKLAGGVPFIPQNELSHALAGAGVTGDTAAAIVAHTQESQLEGLRSALSVLALIALVAMSISTGIPTRQPGADPACRPPTT
jgi:hypothetical protein